MDKLGIPTCHIKWTKSLIYDRRSRVRWNAITSKSRVFHEGLPQGSVLAPLLWLINDISEGCSSKALWSLFADDTGILATARSLKECATVLQPALNHVYDWTKKWTCLPENVALQTSPWTQQRLREKRRQSSA